jgi:hypothetical protein
MPKQDKSHDLKDSFYKELECIFNKFSNTMLKLYYEISVSK